METTLRMFYARAVPAVLLLVALLFLAALMAVSAAAQPAAVPAPAVEDMDLIGLIFSTTSAAIGGLGALIWAAINPPPWLRAIADFMTTKEALNWEGLVNSALDRAEAYARTQFDLQKDRSGYVNAMVMFLHSYNREIVKWADKDGNGVIDLIQTRLPAGSVAPALASGSASASVPADVQGLMSMTATEAATARPRRTIAAPATGRMTPPPKNRLV
jgi:hypothetical protein